MWGYNNVLLSENQVLLNYSSKERRMWFTVSKLYEDIGEWASLRIVWFESRAFDMWDESENV